MSANATATVEAFERSRGLFDALAGELGGPASARASHAQLEVRIHELGLQLQRQLLQDHLDLRAVRERRCVEVIDADGVERRYVESGHDRGLASIFGSVRVTRRAYRAPEATNLYPADAALGLPVEKHSYGLRRLMAIEAGRGSFEAAVEAVYRATGVRLGNRQAQELTVRAAVDIDDFYSNRTPAAAASTDTLLLTADGKGIVMRPEALREATAKTSVSRKLSTRLSAGEKLGRKRMAEVGAVYDAAPLPRR